MFGSKERIAALERQITALADGQRALQDALSTIAQRVAQPGGADGAIHALGSMIEGLSKALATSQEGSQRLLDGLLNRAARQVTSNVAKQMAANSQESRKRNKEIAQLAKGLPSFVAKCEACQAKIQQRAQVHWNDDQRHVAEQHDRLLRLHLGADDDEPSLFRN